MTAWRVLLIAGASGVGKTSVSYRLAQHFKVGITEVDDIQVVVEHITTPDQYPVFHLFKDGPDRFFRMTDQEKLEHAIAYAEAFAPSLEQVIRNHLDGGPPIVLEGDFIHPRLFHLSPEPGLIRGFILTEDEVQIAANYRAREGEDQSERAGNSFRYSEWLRAEATRLGIPALPAQPWSTLIDRALATIG